MIIDNYRCKEISWLSFNERLLQEAEKPEVPLIERIKFLGIYSNNLDEFFRVRVAILKKLASLNKYTMLDGGYPLDILKEIQYLIVQQHRRFINIYEGLLKKLADNNIYLLNENELSEEQGEYVLAYFQNKVRSKLMPIIISKNRKLPDLKDDAIYLAVELVCKGEKDIEYAILKIPSSLNRFVRLPTQGKKQYLMLIDDVIRYELKNIFYMFDVVEARAFTIKLTRDAELNINDDVAQSYVAKIAQSLEKRKDAAPVRFVCDKELPEEFLSMLSKKLNLSKEDAVLKGGRYHNFKDFMGFPKMGSKGLVYPAHVAIPHKDLSKGESILDKIARKDILLHFPYHSFGNFVDLLQEVSIDPTVERIKITIYRVAKNSNVMNALINAARNGKKVTAILELQARFDEKANIKWSNKLGDAGVRVIYGVPGLKVHSKLCLIVRKEKGKRVNYACVGTGNFNEDSAHVFSDHLLLTAHKEIAGEVANIFDFFDKNYQRPRHKHLLLAPFTLRNKISQLIQHEINLVKAGKEGKIYIKVNNLVDVVLIKKLYAARKQGVDVRLNVRGMFSAITTFDQPSNSIPAIGLIDRFLEHSRMYVFGNSGDTKVYISSADVMSRNLDRRVEVACPIYDKSLKAELLEMFDIQWQDNTAARILNNDLDNQLKPEEERKVRSQVEFYNYLSKVHSEGK